MLVGLVPLHAIGMGLLLLPPLFIVDPTSRDPSWLDLVACLFEEMKGLLHL